MVHNPFVIVQDNLDERTCIRYMSCRSSSSKQRLIVPQFTTVSEKLMSGIVARTKRFVAVYDDAILRHPITTKCVTAALLALSGDGFAQVIAHYRQTGRVLDAELDVERAVTFCLAGGIIPALMFHPWYNWLDKLPQRLTVFKPFQNMSKWKNLAVKVAFDQV